MTELGFAFVNGNNKVIVPDTQLKRILNVNETCLEMEGSKCKCGGRTEVAFFSRNLPNLSQ
jgi:hypothetical protein